MIFYDANISIFYAGLSTSYRLGFASSCARASRVPVSFAFILISCSRVCRAIRGNNPHILKVRK
jgi:hypothetical protein